MTLLQKDIRHKQLADALWYWAYIPAAVIVSGKGLDFLLGLAAWPPHPSIPAVSLLLLVLGLGLIWKATRDFAAYGAGTPNPFRPPKRLVSKGAYALCRHPMFLGYDLAALGVVLLFRSPAMLCLSYPLFLLLEVRFLQKEEKILVKRFRAAYEQYKNAVPLLIPNPFSWRKRP